MIDSKFNVESFDGERYKVRSGRPPIVRRHRQDRHHLQIPLSTCWTVLSMGCGTPKPKYAVLAKKQSESNAALKIKLLVPVRLTARRSKCARRLQTLQRHTFVLYEENEKMIIEVNGEQIKEDDFEKFW